jgi:predicted DNA-binding protein (MmcQ/YjbR family)
MDFGNFREYCLRKKGCTEDTPFDETTLVFRVGGKIFALTDMESLPFQCNLKCDPEKAEELRERYDSITPGYHMNKKHWNTVISDNSFPDTLFRELIDHSYELVFISLKKSDRQRILHFE